MNITKAMLINEVQKRIDVELDNFVKAKARGDEEQVEFAKSCINNYRKVLIEEGYYQDQKQKDMVSV